MGFAMRFLILLLLFNVAHADLSSNPEKLGKYYVVDYGAVCDGDKDDGPEINAAIAAADAAGGGVVKIPPGKTCLTSETIVIDGDYIGLELGQGSVIQANTNITVVQIGAPDSYISGGRIYSNVSSFTNAVVLIKRVAETQTWDRIATKQGIFDTQISGKYHDWKTSNTGYCLHVHGDAPGGSASPLNGTIQWMLFDNLSIDNCEEGVRLESNEGATEGTFVSSNSFTNITFDDVGIAVHTTNAEVGNTANDVQANMFVNVQFQPDTDSTRLFLSDGSTPENVHRNMFTNVMVWDWSVTGEATSIEIDPLSLGNTFVSIEGVARDEIDALLTPNDNIFISRSLDIATRRNARATAIALTPADYDGVIYRINETNGSGLYYSNGDYWGILSGSGNIQTTLDTSNTSTGTATSASASKLVDTAATFVTDGVTVGAAVLDSTDSVTAYVTAVDSETQLSLSSDIFNLGTETYEVGRIYIMDKAELIAGRSYTTDSATGGAPFVINIGAGKAGAEVLIQRNNSNKEVRITGEGGGGRIRDTNNTTFTSANGHVELDTNFNEIHLRASFANNWYTIHKYGTTFTFN